MEVARNRLGAGFFLFVTFSGSANRAWAAANSLPEDDSIFSILGWVTFASAIGSALVSLYFSFRSESSDAAVFKCCVPSMCLITFLTFYAGILPIVDELSIEELFGTLYVPAALLGFMIIATALWLRTLVQQYPSLVIGPGTLRKQWDLTRKRFDLMHRGASAERRRAARRRRPVKA